MDGEVTCGALIGKIHPTPQPLIGGPSAKEAPALSLCSLIASGQPGGFSKARYSAWKMRGILRGKCVNDPTATRPTPDTMFERYGGLSFISRVVLSFYDRVLASVRLAPFFVDTDMQRLVEHQAKFIASVMGGPECYTEAMLRDAHAHLPIDDRAFDEM